MVGLVLTSKKEMQGSGIDPMSFWVGTGMACHARYHLLTTIAWAPATIQNGCVKLIKTGSLKAFQSSRNMYIYM